MDTYICIHAARFDKQLNLYITVGSFYLLQLTKHIKESIFNEKFVFNMNSFIKIKGSTDFVTKVKSFKQYLQTWQNFGFKTYFLVIYQKVHFETNQKVHFETNWLLLFNYVNCISQLFVVTVIFQRHDFQWLLLFNCGFSISQQFVVTTVTYNFLKVLYISIKGYSLQLTTSTILFFKTNYGSINKVFQIQFFYLNIILAKINKNITNVFCHKFLSMLYGISSNISICPYII
eukprot:TRINITY_DN771_c1_g1_i2.p2 TRINITY_DN771_c1_g1~~TRINITY_DN771_c1_g1_i2.p2  ORF type:complete len:232 (-),score=-17.78 TRINITY_DN771_c1_g1_i2:583-1278(-)